MEPKQWAEHRAKYMNGEHTFSQHYGEIADAIGRGSLEKMLPITDPATLKARLEKDEHLNNISLASWDSKDPVVRRMAFQAGFPQWSLSDTVCVLKEVARQVASRA